jgi:hypothetical protein
MTPKEKAQQLRDKFYFETTITELEEAKECALIVVNEIIEECDKFFEAISKNRKQYWQKVKKKLIEL